MRTIKRHGCTYFEVFCPECNEQRFVTAEFISKTDPTQSSRRCIECSNKSRPKGKSLQTGYERPRKDGAVVVRQEDGTVIAKHRLLMEEWLKRPLRTNEVVKFRNDDKTDLRRENLYVASRHDFNKPEKQDIRCPNPGCRDPMEIVKGELMCRSCRFAHVDPKIQRRLRSVASGVEVQDPHTRLWRVYAITLAEQAMGRPWNYHDRRTSKKRLKKDELRFADGNRLNVSPENIIVNDEPLLWISWEPND